MDGSPEQRAQVPLFDLSEQHSALAAEINGAIARVLRSGQFILGPDVAAFEQELAAYCGVEHAIGVSSGSDALLAALLALEIGPGDEVITTPYTFFASIEAILRVGARPVFVDIDPESLNMTAERVHERVNARTRAILPVHLFGQPADMAPLLELAKERNLTVIEDAAQAIGAQYHGKRAGNLGHIACFSFFPTKNLGALGDAGAVTTNDPKLAERVQSLRNHGFSRKHESVRLGGNFRLDALQAAVLRVKLPHLEMWIAKRRANAAAYFERFTHLQHPHPHALSVPREPAHVRHVYNQFVIRCRARDELQAFLRARNIGCEVYYPLPAHLSPTCAFLGHALGDFAEAERAAKETLAIPIYPELSRSQLELVADAICEFETALATPNQH